MPFFAAGAWSAQHFGGPQYLHAQPGYNYTREACSVNDVGELGNG